MKRTMTVLWVAVVLVLSGLGCNRLFPGDAAQDTETSADSEVKTSLHQQAMEAITAQKYDDAVALVKEMAAAKPDDVDTSLVLCQLYAVLNNTTDGPAACEKVISLDNSNSDAYAYLGRLYLHADKLGKARKQLKDSMAVNDKHVPTLSGLGAVFLQMKKYDKAVEVLTVAHQENAADKAISMNLALSLIQLLRCDEAADVIESAGTAGVNVDTLSRLKEKRCTGEVAAAPATSTEDMVQGTDASGKAFFIDKRSANGAEFSDCVDEKVCEKPSYDEYNRKGEGRDEPAMSVNFFGAEAYCRWKGKRLPTLAEYQAAYSDLEWRGCCVRGVIPREWTSDAGPSDEKGSQVRKNGDKLEEMSTKKKVGVDSSTVRCALDAPPAE
ncbi:MAG: SUMF1/EgtB/PvdO family nonheme iron enzyme [Deltaproteobacteria bacterium]|nr:SUMF1/EgtB/PvdO family nonheme iron enzyme [Deltaproteobacteria bacterium]MBN2673744.1 SUMF1/EgtB/PvdO family nonheme iron enzyme [Deltaproteobacteria bacterium]